MSIRIKNLCLLAFIFLCFTLFLSKASASIYKYGIFEVQEYLGRESIDLEAKVFSTICIDDWLCDPYINSISGFDSNSSLYKFNISSTDNYNGLVDISLLFGTTVNTSSHDLLMSEFTYMIDTSLNSSLVFSDSASTSNDYSMILSDIELNTDYTLETSISLWANNSYTTDHYAYMDLNFSVPMIYTVTKSVPEPSSFALLIIGLFGFSGYRKYLHEH